MDSESVYVVFWHMLKLFIHDLAIGFGLKVSITFLWASVSKKAPSQSNRLFVNVLLFLLLGREDIFVVLKAVYTFVFFFLRSHRLFIESRSVIFFIPVVHFVPI